MSSKSIKLAAPGYNSTVFRPMADLKGVRRVDSLATSAAVYAGPNDKIAQLVQFGGLTGRPLVYVLCSANFTYIGRSGNGERRLADQLRDNPQFDEIFVVCWNDPRISMKSAAYFEAVFIGTALQNGILLSNKTRPIIPELSEPERADHERLFYEARLLLHDAGCAVLEPPPSSDKKKDQTSRNFQTAIGLITIPLMAPTFELKVHGVWARAIEIDNGHFYVLPGSEYCLKANKTLHRCIHRRRANIEAALKFVPVHGDSDRARLMSLVDLQTRATAAKVLTGWHIGSGAWKPVSACPLVHVAG